MPRLARITAIGTATLTLAGITAVGASAIGYNGGAFTATAPGSHTFTLSGFYDIECSNVSATGNATGSDTVSLTTSFAGCDLLGFPATVTVSPFWDFQLIKPPPPPGMPYRTALIWTAGTTTTITIPIVGCSVVLAGPQLFSQGVGWNHLTSANETGGVEITTNLYGANYTASSSCPFVSGSDGQYTGTFFLPGVAIY